MTFDDGFANNFSVAFPILRRHGVPFTVFVTTGLLDTPGAMLWTERAKRSLYLYPERSVTIRLDGIDLTLDLSSPSSRADACKSVLQRMKRLPPDARNQALDDLEAVVRPAADPGARARALRFPDVVAGQRDGVARASKSARTR